MERAPNFENLHQPEHLRESLEQEVKSPEKEVQKHEPAQKIEDIRKLAHKEALEAKQVKLEQSESNLPDSGQAYVNKELKTMAYLRLLNRARKQLNPLQRPLSKFMHQRLVESVSETASKTVGRPSGILGGGVIALAGTSAYYYVTKHYGYDYNFFVFLLLLGAGFVAGWTTELLFKLLRGRRNQ